MKKFLFLAAILFSASSLMAQTEVIAHRGFHAKQGANSANNTISSLKNAQDLGVYGSEVDINETKDGKLVAIHGPKHHDYVVQNTDFAVLRATPVHNGETLPTFEEYLEQTKKNGVSEDIAGFTIPLCATIHMSGSTLKIVACSLALMIMQDMPYDFWSFFGFICMLGITMVAAPGVPGGAIMASLGLLQSMLGFNTETQALMIALYIAMDSFGTACNVTGDGAIAVIVDRLLGKVK